MVNCPVIDADGHVLEKERYIRKYLEPPWDKRSTPLRTRDQPWDANLFDSFEMAVRWKSSVRSNRSKSGTPSSTCFVLGAGFKFDLKPKPLGVS